MNTFGGQIRTTTVSILLRNRRAPSPALLDAIRSCSGSGEAPLHIGSWAPSSIAGKEKTMGAGQYRSSRGGGGLSLRARGRGSVGESRVSSELFPTCNTKKRRI